MITQENLTIYCDGGSRNNPGEAAYGFVVYDDNKKIHEEGRRIGIATNNVAEYTAVIEALKWVTAHYKNTKKLMFFLDSSLAVNQLNGIFKIKSEHLRDLFFTIKSLEKMHQLSTVFTAIPREKNKAADRMVNLALDNLI